MMSPLWLFGTPRPTRPMSPGPVYGVTLTWPRRGRKEGHGSEGGGSNISGGGDGGGTLLAGGNFCLSGRTGKKPPQVARFSPSHFRFSPVPKTLGGPFVRSSSVVIGGRTLRPSLRCGGATVAWRGVTVTVNCHFGCCR